MIEQGEEGIHESAAVVIVECSSVLQAHADAINDLQVLNDVLYSCSSDKTIKSWDPTTGKCVATFAGHTNWVRCMEVFNDVLYSGSADRTICAWDPNTGKCLTTWSSEQTSLILHDRSYNYEGSIDHTIRGWDTTSGKCIITLNGHTNWVRCMAVLNGILYSGSDDRTIRGWDIAHGRCTSIMSGHTSLVLCLHSLHGYLFSGSRDKTIRGWNPTNGSCDFTLEGHTADVNCLCTFNAMLFSGSDDRTIRSWDIKKRTCVLVINGHTNAVNCLQVCKSTLFSGSADKTIRGWRSISEETILPLIQQYTKNNTSLSLSQSSKEGDAEITRLQEEIRMKDQKLKKVKEEKKALKKELRKAKQGKDRKSKELQKLEIEVHARASKRDDEFIQSKRDLDQFRLYWRQLSGNENVKQLVEKLLECAQLGRDDNLQLQSSDILCKLLQTQYEKKESFLRKVSSMSDVASECERCDDMICTYKELQDAILHTQQELHATQSVSSNESANNIENLIQQRDSLRSRCRIEVEHLAQKLEVLNSYYTSRLASLQEEAATITQSQTDSFDSSLDSITWSDIQKVCQNYTNWRQLTELLDNNRRQSSTAIQLLIASLNKEIPLLKEIKHNIAHQTELFNTTLTYKDTILQREIESISFSVEHLGDLRLQYAKFMASWDTALNAPPPAYDKLNADKIQLEKQIATQTKAVNNKTKKLQYLRSLDEQDEERAEIPATEAQLHSLNADLVQCKEKLNLLIHEAVQLAEHFPEIAPLVAADDAVVGSGETVDRSLKDFDQVTTTSSGTFTGKLDGKKFLLKEILLGNTADRAVAQKSIEVNMKQINKLKHPLLAKVDAIFYEGMRAYLQIPYPEYGSLHHWLFGTPLSPTADPTFSAVTSKTAHDITCVVYKVIQAVAFLHHHGIYPNDLTLDSIYMQSDYEPLILSKERTVLSTPNVPSAYIAPELLGSSHTPTPATDMWSIGVLLFKIFFGSAILQQPVNVPQHPNSDLCDLVQHLLRASPESRLTAEEALAHPLFLRAGYDRHKTSNSKSAALNQKLDLVRSFTAEQRQQMKRSDSKVVVTLKPFCLMESLFEELSKILEGTSEYMSFVPLEFHLLPSEEPSTTSTFTMSSSQLYRSFFCEVFKEEYDLFEKSANGWHYIPKVSASTPPQLSRLKVFGYLLVRVLLEECCVHAPIAPAVWKYLLNKPPNYRDLEIFDPLQFKKLVQKINLPSITEYDSSYEGIADSGEKILVTENNISNLLDYKAEKLFVSSRKLQLEAIKQGFQCNQELASHLALLRTDDIQILVGMHNFVSFQMIQPLFQWTEEDFAGQSQVPKNFMDCLASLDNVDLRRFLIFCSQRNALVEAFQHMPLCSANRSSAYPPAKITLVPKQRTLHQSHTLYTKISVLAIGLPTNQSYNEVQDNLLHTLQGVNL